MSGKKNKTVNIYNECYNAALSKEIEKVGEQGSINTALSLINRRRQQILVHSCIYYRFDKNIVQDHTFDRWCRELIDLQTKHPEIAKLCPYHEDFKGLSHASGFDLPYNNPEVVSRALHLIELHKSRQGLK